MKAMPTIFWKMTSVLLLFLGGALLYPLEAEAVERTIEVRLAVVPKIWTVC